MTGNVLINSNANRLSQYYVWSYGPGDDSYYQFLYIDFAASQDKVCFLSVVAASDFPDPVAAKRPEIKFIIIIIFIITFKPLENTEGVSKIS